MSQLIRAIILLSYCAVASHGVSLLRGPYLQSGSPTTMVVKWRTDDDCDSLLRFGTLRTALTNVVSNTTATTEHEIRVTELAPNTRYFYSVGSSQGVLASGTDFFFTTSPTNARPTRVWVIGDSGSADGRAAEVRNSYDAFTAGRITDLWLMLGDNAYEVGSDAQYQAAVFDMYPGRLRNTVVWPTVGNHDTGDYLPTERPPPYLEIFTLPSNGECGGVASGSELYYSFDYGNIHFICLDSQMSDRGGAGPMLAWLENDLAATDKDWIIAYWHHPPYSWGTHDSDWEFQMVEMRENALPVLEAYGVDLVLTGHSHVYERSFLLDGHYGPSWQLTRSNIVAVTSPFRKASGALGAHRGAVYAVCGCSGAGGAGDFSLHPAIAVNGGGYGSMVLDFDGPVMTAQFLRPSGNVDDTFTIDKSGPTTIRPSLELVREGAAAVLSWPVSNPAYSLESSAAIPASNWAATAGAQLKRGRSNYMTMPIGLGNAFFRLRQSP